MEFKNTTEKLEKIFNLFSDESNMIPRSNIVNALRSTGLIVKDDILDNYTQEHFTLFEFIEIILLIQSKNLNESREKVEESFKFYDPEGTGYIKAIDLKKILLNNKSFEEGDKDKSVDVFFEHFRPNEAGMVNYNVFINYIYESLSKYN